MATINIIENKINNSLSIRNNNPYPSIIINDNTLNNISIVDVRGLQGPPGPSGIPGLSVVGPQGIAGEQGPKGDMGPPGSGIMSIVLSDDTDNELVIDDNHSAVSLVGIGGTKVSIVDNNVVISSEILAGSYAPIEHRHYPSEILDLNEYIDDRTSNLLRAGSHVNITYQDADFNSLTISVTGLDIGHYTQAHSRVLDSISKINVGSGYLLYTTNQDTVSTSFVSNLGLNFLKANTTPEQRGLLGLGSISTFSHSDFAKIAEDNFFQGNQNFGNGTIASFSASIVLETASNYTINQSNNGKIIVFNNNNSAINISFDNNIAQGFNCLIVQGGSGQVRIIDTVYNRYNHTKLVGQYSIATLLKMNHNTIILSGDTTSFNSGP